MVFELVHDLADVLAAMPRDHARHRILTLLDEALRRDVHFIDRHPTTLFQCLWNSCWWYDCPEASAHYQGPDRPVPTGVRAAIGKIIRALGFRGRRPQANLSRLLEAGRTSKEARTPGFLWLRALRPPEVLLGSHLTAEFRFSEREVMAIAVSPDGRCIASGDRSGVALVFERASGVELFRWCRPYGGCVECVAFSPDSRTLAFGEGDTIRLFDLQSGSEVRPAVQSPGKGRVTHIAFAPTCDRLTTVAGGKVYLWNAECRGEVVCVDGPGANVTTAAVSCDSRFLAGGLSDGAVCVWDLEGAREVWRARGHQRGCVHSIAFSPDGRLVASGGADATVRVWQAADGRELHCLRGHEEPPKHVFVRIATRINGVAFSHNSTRLVSGADDETVRLWDAHAGVELLCLRRHASSVSSVAFSADGRCVVSASEDRTICVWQVDLLEPPRHLPQHEQWVTGAAFSPDGRLLATSSKDGTVGLWEVETGLRRAPLHGHDHGVEFVAFAPDGRRILSYGEDMTVRVWDPKTSQCVEVVPAGDRTGRVWFLCLQAIERWDGCGRLQDSEAYRQAEVASFLRTVGRDVSSPSPPSRATQPASVRPVGLPPVMESGPIEQAVRSALTGQVMAWYARSNQLLIVDPQTGRHTPRVPAHGPTRTWALINYRFVYLIRLEGDRRQE